MKNQQTTMNSHPKFIEAQGTLEKLRAALAAEQQTEAQLSARLAVLAIAPGQTDEVETALLLANGSRAPSSNVSLTEAVSASRGKQTVLQSGIDRQHQRIIDLSGELSHSFCLEKREAHVAIAKRILAALGELRAAVDAETALRDSIKSAGYHDRLPGLHNITFEASSNEANAVSELDHYAALHGAGLYSTKKKKGIALRDFDLFGAVGRAGESLEVSEITAELLRHAGAFDVHGIPAKRMIEAAEICY
jgi:hypothetical protein